MTTRGRIYQPFTEKSACEYTKLALISAVHTINVCLILGLDNVDFKRMMWKSRRDGYNLKSGSFGYKD